MPRIERSPGRGPDIGVPRGVVTPRLSAGRAVSGRRQASGSSLFCDDEEGSSRAESEPLLPLLAAPEEPESARAKFGIFGIIGLGCCCCCNFAVPSPLRSSLKPPDEVFSLLAKSLSEARSASAVTAGCRGAE